ncbi:putative membrane protein [Bacteroides fragilis str. 1007-1-F |uniref:Membrane protein n=1 Tax=Bacteroides fragilis str. 1007-1-F \|nr:putative membrane protein [Bacteroides fragilis str. 1007-1-F \
MKIDVFVYLFIEVLKYLQMICFAVRLMVLAFELLCVV